MQEPSSEQPSPDSSPARPDLKQDDIDALFRSGADRPPESASETQEQPTAAPAENVGPVSQSDIDALLQAAAEDAAAADSAAPPGPAQEEPASETLTSVTDERLDSLGRPFDEAAAAMQAAIEEERAASASKPAMNVAGEVAAMPPGGAVLQTQPYELPELDVGQIEGIDAKRVSMLSDVNLRVKVELGRTRMLVEDVLRLGEGSVVELDKLAGDPVDVFVNERLVARGEVLVLNDNFCVRINDVLTHDPHRVTT